MSKIADVFGRFEAFCLSVLLFVIGYIQQAASNNVKTYAAAQIFYAAGSTGLQLLIQIFIADTSDLLNRALVSRLPDVPFLLTVWIGPLLAEHVLQTSNWRWGYGVWAVVLPLAFLPLALALVINQRTAAKRGILPESHYKGMSTLDMAKTIYYELDVVGLLLICTSFSLILIPLALTGTAGLHQSKIIVMLVTGVVCLAIFPFWERNKTLAPRSFFPRDLFKQRNVLVGLGIAFFYFSESMC